MTYITSCGFVPYREVGGERQYLILHSRNGDCGFPKGHMEQGETEHETAVRELKEETNLEVRIIDGFRRPIEYPFPGRENVIKRSIYFLGRCVTDDLVCQECEVADAAFVPFEQALEALTFAETKEILRDADAFLHSGTPIGTNQN